MSEGRRISSLSPVGRILSVSYDEVLMRTRELLLRNAGHRVTSALGFTESIKQCKQGAFDLFILGHSIPHSDKIELVSAFRGSCPAPIISLRRNQGDEKLMAVADYVIDPDPEALLMLVNKIVSDQHTTPDVSGPQHQ
jgi:CheY-like chemotaxis protein